MSLRVAINGFGRIGRNFLRASSGYKDFEIVALNDLTDSKSLSHLLKYDSVHGIYNADVKSGNGSVIVDGREIKVLGVTEPDKLPWKDMGVDVEAFKKKVAGELFDKVERDQD